VTAPHKDDGRTEQHHAKNCDINYIVKRGLANNGVFPGTTNQARNLDLSSLPSYQEALNTVLEAEAAFLKLPALVRKEFNHDPGIMLEFLSDEGNKERAAELGLLDLPVVDPEPETAPAPIPPSSEE
jgi:phage internal scaffolding protein